MGLLLSHVLAIPALLSLACAARAEDVASFFRGQTINIVVGSDPGGGYDAYARPVSRHLGRLIPGEPGVQIKYMPGAAGLVAGNYLFSAAPRDGLTIGAMQRQIPFEPLRGNAAARYDAFSFGWLGSVTAETSVFIVRKDAPHMTARDILTTPMIAASLGAGTDSEVESIAMARLLGAPIKLVSGYLGTPEALLALERGEVQGVHGISWSYIKTKKADWIRDGAIRVLLQTGLAPAVDLATTPSVYDLIAKPDDRPVWDLILAPKAMSRPYLLPPGIPAERAAALRNAFTKLLNDPEFRADLAQQKLDIEPMTGDAELALARKLYALPPDAVARMRAAIAPRG